MTVRDSGARPSRPHHAGKMPALRAVIQSRTVVSTAAVETGRGLR